MQNCSESPMDVRANKGIKSAPYFYFLYAPLEEILDTYLLLIQRCASFRVHLPVG